MLEYEALKHHIASFGAFSSLLAINYFIWPSNLIVIKNSFKRHSSATAKKKEVESLGTKGQQITSQMSSYFSLGILY